jgi:dolichyl-phosphate beta-glucosyltransferase
LRHLSGGDSKPQRTLFRSLLGIGFHWLTILSDVRRIRVTQWSFKLFSREAVRLLFSTQNIQRWCFDVELLVIERRRKMEIAEVPSNGRKLRDQRWKWCRWWRW